MKTGKRWKLLLAAGAAVVSIVAVTLFLRGHSVGEGPAGPSVDRNAFATPLSSRTVLLLGLGDSVTAGFGARKGYSYFARLRTNPSDEFEDLRGISLSSLFPKLQSTNLAVSGSTSFEHLEKQMVQLPSVESNALGIVVMTTGGNDLIHFYGRTPPRSNAMYGATWTQAQPWVQEFEHRLEQMIQQVTARFPGGCHIFLANIYDPTDGQGDIEKAGLPAWPDGLRILAAYNEVIRRSTERHQHVHLVDLHSLFLGHGLHCRQFWTPHYRADDPHYWYYVNLEDPNERGYDAIRRLYLIRMAEVLRTSAL